MIAHEIKNLIFDLGGVILDLDVTKTHEAFGQLAGLPANEIKIKTTSQDFFNDYEKGLLTDEQFREKVRYFLNHPATDKQIDHAWNAMLLTISKEKYELLKQLKTHYGLFLLSNTNNIHLQCFNEIVRQDTGHPHMDHYFHKAYYSHIMKMRKPDDEIYFQVLNENKLAPTETLFLDDNVENIKSASSLGIQTHHITSSEMILSLFA